MKTTDLWQATDKQSYVIYQLQLSRHWLYTLFVQVYVNTMPPDFVGLFPLWTGGRVVEVIDLWPQG